MQIVVSFLHLLLLGPALAAPASHSHLKPAHQQQQQVMHAPELTDSQMRAEGFRLISIAPNSAEWMSEADILGLYQSETKFIDMTDGDWASFSQTRPTQFDVPFKPQHEEIVNPLLEDIDEKKMEAWLTKFTSFKTRYYQSPTGKESAEWLYNQLTTVAKKADSSKVKITVSKFQHDWTQFSLILRLEDATSKKEEPVVIISAHQDSTNMWNPWWGAAPGADDDGSGSATIFEALRILVEKEFVPKRPLEFHWYSAEEAGLLGSQKIVADYKERDVDVAGVFHADMTGYTPDDSEEVIGIATDYVDDELEEFVRELVKVYNKGTKIIDTECGYGCSDHASWTKAGYRASFTFETSFKESSPYIHSTNDIVENISFWHMAKFVRVAIAFAVELSLY